MAGSAPFFIPPRLQDPLEHLPCSNIESFKTGQCIYGPAQGRAGLYVVLEGVVKVSRQTREGRSLIIDLYLPDEFFGEAVLIGISADVETAVAFHDTKVMVWTAAEVKSTASTQPRFALALLQSMVRREAELIGRIETYSAEPIHRRLAAALVYLSHKVGRPAENGDVELPHFTHRFLAEYVGAARELVTVHMSDFRRRGYVRYSRSGI